MPVVDKERCLGQVHSPCTSEGFVAARKVAYTVQLPKINW